MSKLVFLKAKAMKMTNFIHEKFTAADINLLVSLALYRIIKATFSPISLTSVSNLESLPKIVSISVSVFIQRVKVKNKQGKNANFCVRLTLRPKSTKIHLVFSLSCLLKTHRPLRMLLRKC